MVRKTNRETSTIECIMLRVNIKNTQLSIPFLSCVIHALYANILNLSFCYKCDTKSLHYRVEADFFKYTNCYIADSHINEYNLSVSFHHASGTCKCITEVRKLKFNESKLEQNFLFLCWTLASLRVDKSQ